MAITSYRVHVFALLLLVFSGQWVVDIAVACDSSGLTAAARSMTSHMAHDATPPTLAAHGHSIDKAHQDTGCCSDSNQPSMDDCSQPGCYGSGALAASGQGFSAIPPFYPSADFDEYRRRTPSPMDSSLYRPPISA